MSIRRCPASTGGADSCPTELLHGHECGAEVPVPREQVRRKVQPESGRV